MTAPIGTTLDRRCKSCGFDPEAQGHRSLANDIPTGCTDSGPLGLMLARQRRDEGMQATVEAHPDDAALVDRVLDRFIRSGRPFTANDTRPHLAGVKGSVIGSRFNAASRRGRMKRTGNRVPSTDPGTHAHRIDEWIAA